MIDIEKEVKDFEECDRQKKHLERTIKYLKEEDLNCLCLKSELVTMPKNFLWITEANLDMINTKTMLKAVKKIVIESLSYELEVLMERHEKIKRRYIFFTAQI